MPFKNDAHECVVNYSTVARDKLQIKTNSIRVNKKESNQNLVLHFTLECRCTRHTRKNC